MVVMIDEVFYPCMYRVHRPGLAQIRWHVVLFESLGFRTLHVVLFESPNLSYRVTWVTELLLVRSNVYAM